MVKQVKTKTKQDPFKALLSAGFKAGADIEPIKNWCPTGSYLLNSLFSADINKGVPEGKIITLAGEPSTAKSFFALSIAHEFLKSDKEHKVIYVDSEGGLDKGNLEKKGIIAKEEFDEDGELIVNDEASDLASRFVLMNKIATLEEFESNIQQLFFNNLDVEDRGKYMLIVDSISMFSTEKVTADLTEGMRKEDASRTPKRRNEIVKHMCSVCAKYDITTILVAHVYDSMNQYEGKKIAGGKGITYTPHTVIMLGKSLVKDKDKKAVGVEIRALVKKSRMVREGLSSTLLLSFDKGLDKYYGLLEVALVSGVWTQRGAYIEFENGEKKFKSEVEKNPEKYFTADILDKINEYIKNTWALEGKDLSKEIVLDLDAVRNESDFEEKKQGDESGNESD